MILEDIYSHDCIIEIWIGTLSDIIVEVLFVSKCIEAFEYEFKNGLQILRTGTGNKYVGISVRKGSGNA